MCRTGGAFWNRPRAGRTSYRSTRRPLASACAVSRRTSSSGRTGSADATHRIRCAGRTSMRSSAPSRGNRPGVTAADRPAARPVAQLGAIPGPDRVAKRADLSGQRGKTGRRPPARAGLPASGGQERSRAAAPPPLAKGPPPTNVRPPVPGQVPGPQEPHSQAADESPCSSPDGEPFVPARPLRRLDARLQVFGRGARESTLKSRHPRRAELLGRVSRVIGERHARHIRALT